MLLSCALMKTAGVYGAGQPATAPAAQHQPHGAPLDELFSGLTTSPASSQYPQAAHHQPQFEYMQQQAPQLQHQATAGMPPLQMPQVSGMSSGQAYGAMAAQVRETQSTGCTMIGSTPGAQTCILAVAWYNWCIDGSSTMLWWFKEVEVGSRCPVGTPWGHS